MFKFLHARMIRTLLRENSYLRRELNELQAWNINLEDELKDVTSQLHKTEIRLAPFVKSERSSK